MTHHDSPAAPAIAVPIFPVLLVNFIGTLGYSIILPFLIILVLKFGGDEFTYGILGATYSFFQLIGAPVLGNWSDRYGRRRILLLSQGGTFIAWVLFIIALLLPASPEQGGGLAWPLLSLPLLILFAARALDGLTGGNVSVANAYLADVTPEKERKKNFGKMAAAANLGFIIGPAMAGILGETSLREMLPVLAAALISLLAIFVIVFVMPESRPCVLTETPEEQEVKKIFGQEHKDCYKLAGAKTAGLKDVLRLQQVPFLLLLYFVIFLAFNVFYVSFPVHAVQSLNWSLLKLGIFFSLLGFILVIVEGPVLGRIAGKFSDSRLMIAGSALLAVAFFLFSYPSEAAIFGAALLFSTGNGIMWPSFLSLLSRVAGSRYQGAVQGYAGSAGSLASIIGLISGGLIYGQLGEMTFAIPAVLFLLIFFLAIRLVGAEQSIESV